MLEAIASRLEAIATRSEAVGSVRHAEAKAQDHRPHQHDASILPRRGWKQAADACALEVQDEERGEAQDLLVSSTRSSRRWSSS